MLFHKKNHDEESKIIGVYKDWLKNKKRHNHNFNKIKNYKIIKKSNSQKEKIESVLEKREDVDKIFKIKFNKKGRIGKI